MAENNVDVPESVWERIASDKRALVAVVAGALVLAFVVGAIVVRAVSGGSSDDGSAVNIGFDDAYTTSSAGDDSAGSEDTDDESGGSGDDASDSADRTDPASSVARVAYRLDDSLWVIDEESMSSEHVVDSAGGSFSLSPDGTVLARVEADTGELHLTQVGTGDDTVVGEAEDYEPAWAPDSSYLVYTDADPGGSVVRSVNRDGSDDAAVADGHSPAVSSDGDSIAYIDAETRGVAGPIVVERRAGSADRLDAALSTCVAFGVDGLVYPDATGPGGGRPWIVTSRLDGSAPRRLARQDEGSRRTTYSLLMVSPGGSHFVFGATGDDGYSRAYIVDTEDPDAEPLSVSVRRDAYPIGWSESGEYLYFVEGNAFQGESTALMRVDTEGLGRTVIVEGAGL